MQRPAVRVRLLGSLVLVICLMAAGLTRPALAESGIERPFELRDASGRSVTDRDLRGRWLLVYFGYTRCPDLCPTALAEMEGALEKLGPLKERVQPIFVSLDPERDTPEVLREYVSAFGPRILALTGTEAQLARAAATFGVLYFRIAGDGPSDYTLAHSPTIHLVGPEGGLVTRFSATDPADRIAATLRALM